MLRIILLLLIPNYIVNMFVKKKMRSMLDVVLIMQKKDIQNAKRRANYAKKKELTIKYNTNNCELDIKNAKRRANYAKKKN